MGDYNPRQITQMRWKDAKTLEHLIFKANDIQFSNGNVYKLSESLEAKQLVKYIAYCCNNQVPLIIYEYDTDRIFVASNFGDTNEVSLNCLTGNINIRPTLLYDGEDTLSISTDNKIFLTDGDAPKMYRHNLKISHNRTTYDDNQHDIFFTYYSSNNLKVDTPEKLTTLTKAANGTNLRAPVYSSTNAGSSDYDQISLSYIGARYRSNAWTLMNSDDTSSNIAINSVTDTVEEA